MCNTRALSLVLLLLHLVVTLVSANGTKSTSPWQTLSGNPPLVIARGGFSGLFPDSSQYAYNLAVSVSLPNVILWCDVQLTKDGAGICLPDFKLENSTNIVSVHKNRNKVYLVNGVSTKGWFSVDFTLTDLANVFLNQGVYSRTNRFDGNMLQILTVEDVAKSIKPPGFWLNIQNDEFFRQHNLSMRSYILSVFRRAVVSYISSPEVAFLKSIAPRINQRKTKLVFRFLGKEQVEPSTKLTYGSLLKNLTFIKTFASGILVPKAYIWPAVDATVDAPYLLPHTSVVSDAHKEQLEVFASDFANDVPFSLNFSYDPVSEQLSFIDNGNFSVDGLLSDFPITSSATIACFAHLGNNTDSLHSKEKPLVISKCGASGDYPGCTDLAYQKAIMDGVEVLDCPVQLSKDGTPFCLSSIDLTDTTTVNQSRFSNLRTKIPQIKAGGSGIFTFNLTWSEIQSLKPLIESPSAGYRLFRNPKYKNAGRFQTLSDFLKLTKNTSSLTGILISIENAAYLAKEQKLSITDAVIDALNKSGYDKQTTQKVMIQSSNSSVLMKFKDKTNYEVVYKVDEDIRDAQTSAVADIKKFADSVVVTKTSVLPENSAFVTGRTDTISKLQSFKLPVYVETFSNEFVSQAWDFFSDATAEINSFVIGANADGVITDFPKTAARYKRNRCLASRNNVPPYMSAVQPGSLINVISSAYMPPAEAPSPVLIVSDVAEPPLPPTEVHN